MRNTGAYLDDVVAIAHLLAFFVKYDAVFVEDWRLSVNDSFWFGEFALVIGALR